MTIRPNSGVDLARITFVVVALGALAAASFWILRPFVGPIIWATMIVVATWPLLRRAERFFGGRRWAAVLLMTLALLLLLVVPLTMAVGTIVGNADRLVEWGRMLAGFELPVDPPAWLAGLPLVGEMAANAWRQVAGSGLKGMFAQVLPFAGDLTRGFVGQVGDLGLLLVQFLVTVGIAGVMYAGGEQGAAGLRRFAARLAGPRGEGAVQLAGDAIRGVALGVGVTAIVQSLLGGVGLAIAGVPFVELLTALMLMLCIAQLGPTLVLLPATIWVFWQGDTGWGVFLAVWTLIVGTMDNVLRPVLIRMGADLPLLLILAGVIGGLLAFGLVGIFVGPVVLAVAWTLLKAWVDDSDLPPRG
ncbi:MAG: AI-2E family transporter YdiK [Rubrivivax sp.]|jgi:predicted PurR-regulated permease PerM|nr:AI-2E family transporter YdiK [Rubrivivax sp.]